MKAHWISSGALLVLFTSLASAQLLTHGDGSLPACGKSCSVLTAAQSTCGSSWSCFCQTVWKNSNGALTTMCPSCSATDATTVSSWYSANCGSDNGASEHSGSGGGGNSGSGNGNSGGGSGNAATASTSAVPSSSASAVAGTSSCSGGWFSCHWKWVVMLIVLFVGLLALGLIGRWFKKRHDRKRDEVNGSFNAGITSRGQSTINPHTTNAPVMSSTEVHSIGGRDSPARTRDAFMPYGYGYTRSESRLAGRHNDPASPLARGSTPMGDMEKDVGVGEEVESPQKKSKRVLVREKLGRHG